MLKLMGKKIFTFYADIFYLSKPVIFISGTPLPRDCSEINDTRNQHYGPHTIYPFGVQHMPAYVYCEFDASGTAWTVCLFFHTIEWLGSSTLSLFIYIL